MGNPKQKWTAEEEDALRAGVAKHGAGKWKLIQRDPEFNRLLFTRSNIDLKDKWRNLSGSGSGQTPRDKSRTAKPKATMDGPAATLPAAQTSPTPVPHDASETPAIDDPSKRSVDAKSPPKYNSMIFEALSALKEPNGSDIGAIVNYIEQRHETPQNFRRLLGSRLRRLAAQDKLEKVQHRYKMKKDTMLSVKTPLPKQKETLVRPSQSPCSIPSSETVEAAAETAAYKIVEAENKSFVAAEAVKEAERVSRMAEDADSLVQFAKEMFERCSRGEIVVMA